jgi:hypothetical protein
MTVTDIALVAIHMWLNRTSLLHVRLRKKRIWIQHILREKRIGIVEFPWWGRFLCLPYPKAMPRVGTGHAAYF